MRFPEDLHYHPGHAWARVEDGVATIGITDHAQKELGDIVFVELPRSGRAFRAGDVFGSVESAKSISELISPVAGEVIEVNTSLEDDPESINDDPYGKGWLIRVKLASDFDASELLDAKAYREQLS